MVRRNFLKEKTCMSNLTIGCPSNRHAATPEHLKGSAFIVQRSTSVASCLRVATNFIVPRRTECRLEYWHEVLLGSRIQYVVGLRARRFNTTLMGIFLRTDVHVVVAALQDGRVFDAIKKKKKHCFVWLFDLHDCSFNMHLQPFVDTGYWSDAFMFVSG